MLRYAARFVLACSPAAWPLAPRIGYAGAGGGVRLAASAVCFMLGGSSSSVNPGHHAGHHSLALLGENIVRKDSVNNVGFFCKSRDQFVRCGCLTCRICAFEMASSSSCLKVCFYTVYIVYMLWHTTKWVCIYIIYRHDKTSTGTKFTRFDSVFRR